MDEEQFYEDEGVAHLSARFEKNLSTRKKDDEQYVERATAAVDTAFKYFNGYECHATRQQLEKLGKHLPKRQHQWLKPPKLSFRAYKAMHSTSRPMVHALHNAQKHLLSAMRLYDEVMVMYDESLPSRRTKEDLAILEAMAEVRGAFYSTINFMSDQKMHAAHPHIYDALPVRRRLLETDDEVFELLGQEQMASAKQHGAILPSHKAPPRNANQQGAHQGNRQQRYNQRMAPRRADQSDNRQDWIEYRRQEFPAPPVQQQREQVGRGNGRGRGYGRGR
jgi:hypothetical protein